MKILVKNLARASKQSDIQSLFAQYGTVESCELVVDEKIGVSKGIAHIDMPAIAEAKNAISNLNNSELHGKRIQVKKSKK